jgi:hypothetical protein
MAIYKKELYAKKNQLEKVIQKNALKLEDFRAYGYILGLAKSDGATAGGNFLYEGTKVLTEEQMELLRESVNACFNQDNETIDIYTVAMLEKEGLDKEQILQNAKSLEVLFTEAQEQQKEADEVTKILHEAGLEKGIQDVAPLSKKQISTLKELNEKYGRMNHLDKGNNICYLLPDQVKPIFEEAVKKWNIHKAAAEGYLDIIKHLLEFYPEEVDRKNDREETPLGLAMTHKQNAVEEYLIESGADTSLHSGQILPENHLTEKQKERSPKKNKFRIVPKDESTSLSKEEQRKFANKMVVVLTNTARGISDALSDIVSPEVQEEFEEKVQQEFQKKVVRKLKFDTKEKSEQEPPKSPSKSSFFGK